MIKTFVIMKVGRVWYTVQDGKYTAKLKIAPEIMGLEVGAKVTVDVQQDVKSSRYGESWTYTALGEPLSTEDASNFVQMRKAFAEAERNFTWAEENAQSGMAGGKAINFALSCTLEAFAVRRQALQVRVTENRERVQAERAQQQTQWAKERAEREQASKKARQARVLFALSDMPSGDTPVRWRGQVIVFTGKGQVFRIDGDAPSLYGHHLLGHEGEKGCYCYYRAATPEEISDLEKEEAMRVAERAEIDRRKAALAAIKGHIVQTGECPAGRFRLDGEKLHNTGDLYGGGDWFVITPDEIWYVENNGADGDEWSRNNVITGGAGAVGWRVPFDAAIVKRLREIEE
jgi:hypothetical protein